MTTPVPGILNRQLALNPLEKVLGELADGLDEATNFGTTVLKQFTDMGTAQRHPIVFIMLLRHYLELLDAASILIRSSSIDPSKLLLRSMLEILFSFKYMFKEETELRASCFIVAQVNRVLSEYEERPPEEYQLHPEWTSNVAQLKAELDCEEHSRAVAEFNRIKSPKRRNPPWYAYFNGPRNMKVLAGHLGLIHLYDAFYRQWSGPLHGTDVFSNRLDSDGKGGTVIGPIRLPRDAQYLAASALNISVDLYSSFTQHLLPTYHEEFKKWFRGVHAFGAKVTGPDFITVSITPPASGE